MTSLQNDLTITAAGVELQADVRVPPSARGAVLFAHGSGSGRHSPRNRYVAEQLNRAGLATVLADLLTEPEEQVDAVTRQHRFDIGLLAARLVGLADWATRYEPTAGLSLGLFGASTGAAAALVAAAARPQVVHALVSRGGRPDLAGPALPLVRAPTLLIVGGEDVAVIELNRRALAQLRTEADLAIVPGATHLFEEPGALDEVARLARQWFERHLIATRTRGAA
jgi:putative phosphoribosyl transferase